MELVHRGDKIKVKGEHYIECFTDFVCIQLYLGAIVVGLGVARREDTCGCCCHRGNIKCR